MTARVTHLHRSSCWTFLKTTEEELDLVAEMGVVGDAHWGATVQHRSRVAVDRCGSATGSKYNCRRPLTHHSSGYSANSQDKLAATEHADGHQQRRRNSG